MRSGCLSLLAPNPTRDLLLWMNDPEAPERNGAMFCGMCSPSAARRTLASTRWQTVFWCCRAACQGDGKWGAVMELYRDSFTSFPNVFGLLAKVQPPQLGLFPDQNMLAGYPQANEQGEAALRYALSRLRRHGCAASSRRGPCGRKGAWHAPSLAVGAHGALAAAAALAHTWPMWPRVAAPCRLARRPPI
jgi:hypothetical protein